MSISLGALKTQVAAAIRDPNGKTFTPTIVVSLIQAALATLGRVAPEEFQEDLTPVANVNEYVLRSAAFSEAIPEIEVKRVEVWDGSQVPDQLLAIVLSSAGQPDPHSQAGYTVWNGKLQLPRYVPLMCVGHEDAYLIRVWGYSPYAPPTDDNSTINISNELQWALDECVRVEVLTRLIGDRNLFTQWQTRMGNTDITPAALANELNMARDNWRKTAREISRLRASG